MIGMMEYMLHWKGFEKQVKVAEIQSRHVGLSSKRRLGLPVVLVPPHRPSSEK